MKNIPALFSVLFIISIITHLLIVLAIYYPGTIFSITLTIGMFFSWLYVSNTLKNFSSGNKGFDIQKFSQKLPVALRYTIIFFALYAFINFIITLSFDSGAGWVDFELGHDKLRGISGFWIFFYLLSASSHYLETR